MNSTMTTEGGATRVRRRTEVTTWLQVVVDAPRVLLNGLLVYWLAAILLAGHPDLVLLVVVAWLLSGLLAWCRPVEALIASIVFKARRATAREASVINRAWAPVARRAGLDPSSYDLWIDDNPGVNAAAASGHLITVTRGALVLPTRQLSAVFAHELGHHVRGHVWWLMLAAWYSLPWRICRRVLSCLPLLRHLPGLILVIAVATFVHAAWTSHPWLFALLAVPVVMAWMGRLNEFRADLTAAELGYGPQLIEVLEGWLWEGADDHWRSSPLRANIFASHPRCSARVLALERYLAAH